MSTTDTRTIIVCLPTRHGDWSSALTAVSAHFGTQPSLTARFPVRHTGVLGLLGRWSAHHLLGVERRRGAVTHAAGGRLSRLDLRRLAKVAWYEACARWSIWRQLTDGLRPAEAWESFARQHHTDPENMTWQQAHRQFRRQPMVAAMLAHNANPTSWCQLDPYEVDGYLAGAAAYATRHMLQATAADAMLTADGRWLSPDSSAFADVVTYLKAAAGHVHQLGRGATVVALTF